jgi:hypothetical protein
MEFRFHIPVPKHFHTSFVMDNLDAVELKFKHALKVIIDVKKGFFAGQTLQSFFEKEVFLWDEKPLDETLLTYKLESMAEVGFLHSAKPTPILVTHKKQSGFNEQTIRLAV